MEEGPQRLGGEARGVTAPAGSITDSIDWASLSMDDLRELSEAAGVERARRARRWGKLNDAGCPHAECGVAYLPVMDGEITLADFQVEKVGEFKLLRPSGSSLSLKQLEEVLGRLDADDDSSSPEFWRARSQRRQP